MFSGGLILTQYLSRRAASITPYEAGEQPQGLGIIKLNTNENPYPPSPKALEVLKSFAGERLRLYPQPDGGRLKSAVAQIYGLTEDHVFCGNGSDEVLGLAFQAFFDGDIVFPDITYSFYPVWADLYGLSYRTVPLKDDFTVPVDALTGGGVVLANPNAPTGIALGLAEVEHILQNNSEHVVIVDEAYASFGAGSAASLIPKYPNLLIVSTMSKSHALAGLRVAFALGQPHLIDGLLRIKDSFNSYPLDMIAQDAAAAAIRDTAYCAAMSEKIIATRECATQRLGELGFKVLPSKANFVFASHPNVSAAALKAYLAENNIYVRHFNKPRIFDYLRITIGTDEQMDALIKTAAEFVHSVSC